MCLFICWEEGCVWWSKEEKTTTRFRGMCCSSFSEPGFREAVLGIPEGKPWDGLFIGVSPSWSGR